MKVLLYIIERNFYSGGEIIVETSWILIFIAIVVVIALVGFLMKSFAKIIIILGVVYLLFHLGFIWGVDDLNEKLHLNKFLKPEVNEQVQKTYSDFSKRREENGVMDTEAVRKAIDDTIQKAVAQASNEMKNVDKEQLIQDLKVKLQSFDSETVAKVLNELKAELAKYNISPDDVQTAPEEPAQS